MRNDIHKPSTIIPADYVFTFSFASPRDGDLGYNLDVVRAERKWWSGHRGHFSCDSCGAHYIEGAVFLHVPTGDHISTGLVCADKMELAYDRSEVAMMRGELKAARLAAIARSESRARLQRFVRETPKDVLRALRHDHHITRDIRDRAIKFGGISPKQAELVLKLAQPKADEGPKAAVPASADRILIEGEVVSIKIQDEFTGRVVITVKVDTGAGSFRVWGTAPRALLGKGELKGCRVSFVAQVSPSDRDPSFGFFRRPAKAKLLISSDTASVTG